MQAKGAYDQVSQIGTLQEGTNGMEIANLKL